MKKIIQPLIYCIAFINLSNGKPSFFLNWTMRMAKLIIIWKLKLNNNVSQNSILQAPQRVYTWHSKAVTETNKIRGNNKLYTSTVKVFKVADKGIRKFQKIIYALVFQHHTFLVRIHYNVESSQMRTKMASRQRWCIEFNIGRHGGRLCGN